MKSKTSTGHVGHISLPGEAKCGGAVASEGKICLAVSSVSMSTRRRKKKNALKKSRSKWLRCSEDI